MKYFTLSTLLINGKCLWSAAAGNHLFSAALKWTFRHFGLPDWKQEYDLSFHPIPCSYRKRSTVQCPLGNPELRLARKKFWTCYSPEFPIEVIIAILYYNHRHHYLYFSIDWWLFVCYLHHAVSCLIRNTLPLSPLEFRMTEGLRYYNFHTCLSWILKSTTSVLLQCFASSNSLNSLCHLYEPAVSQL